MSGINSDLHDARHDPTAVGAFALPANSKDAAVIVTLQAGKSYTIQASGVGGTTREARVEIYEAP